MNRDAAPVTIHILDKEYRVACAEHERQALLASAHYLNSRMKEIRDTGKVVGLERITVMAALNIAHELLQQRLRKEENAELSPARLRTLEDKIEAALRRDKQAEL